MGLNRYYSLNLKLQTTRYLLVPNQVFYMQHLKINKNKTSKKLQKKEK